MSNIFDIRMKSKQNLWPSHTFLRWNLKLQMPKICRRVLFFCKNRGEMCATLHNDRILISNYHFKYQLLTVTFAVIARISSYCNFSAW